MIKDSVGGLEEIPGKTSLRRQYLSSNLKAMRGSHEVSEEHFQQKEQQVQKPKTGMDLTVFAWY